MNDLKTLLTGHMSPLPEEQKNAALLQKTLRNHLLSTEDRSFGSYLLVNVPAQKKRHRSTDTV